MGIAGSRPSRLLNAAALLDKIVVGSADAAEKEVLVDGIVSGLVLLVELAAEVEAGEALAVVGLEVVVEKNELGSTTPRTFFAFSREASFLSSNRNLESFLGSGEG